MSPLVDAQESPARLREGNDEVALLLRGESARRLEPGRPFFAVVQKRTARQIRNVSFTAVGAMCVLALSLWARGEPGATVIAAETSVRQLSAARMTPPELLIAPTDPMRDATTDKLASLHGSERMVSIPEQKIEHSSGKKPQGPSPGVVGKIENLPASPDCGVLSRAGNYSEALGCFRLKSQGRGTSAEIGFLEMARIQRRALGDLSGAIETLEKYQRRFPSGALSPEAERLKQELLRGRKRADAQDDLVAE